MIIDEFCRSLQLGVMGNGDNLAEVPWAGLFCGRAAELAQLSSAYARVEAGGGPEAVVILGESGLGKTRLVQEFFARLSSQVDAAGAEGYWPDRLVRGGNNLAINPDPADCNPTNLAQMRFLWWGIRMLDRQGHNAGLGGVSDSIKFLRAHLEPFARAKLLGARMKQAATGAAVDIAVEVANLFTFGLIGLGKLGVDHAREWKDILDERGASIADGPAAQERQQRESLIDVTLRDLGVLFEASEKKGAQLPAVIMLDDAQWLGEDESSTTFVSRLLRKAEAENWPLLLISTHWEKEWHDGEADACAAVLPSLLRNWPKARNTIVTLGLEPDLEELIKAGFPGLYPYQLQMLLRKAGGNPRLLDEVLRDLSNSPAFFVRSDLTAALSTEGTEYLEAARFEIHELVAKRLSQTDPDLQLSICLSGAQGLRFLPRLTDMAAGICARHAARNRLAEAEHPHAFVTSVSHRVSEFSQPFYRDVAKERLSRLLSEEKAIAALREAVVELAGPDGEFEEITPDEREVALAVGCELLAAKDASDGEQRLAARLFLQRMRSSQARLEKDSAGELAFQLLIAALENRIAREAVSWSEWHEIAEVLELSGRYNWTAAACLSGIEWIDASPLSLESRIVRCQFGFVLRLHADPQSWSTDLNLDELWDETEARARKLMEECDDPRPRIVLIQLLRFNSEMSPRGECTEEQARERHYEAFSIAERLLLQDRSADHLKMAALTLMDIASWGESDEERRLAARIALETARERQEIVGPHWGRSLVKNAVRTQARLHHDAGELAQAITGYRKVVELSEITLGESDSLADMLELIAHRHRLGTVYLEADQTEAARQELVEAEALLDEVQKTMTALPAMNSFDPKRISVHRQVLGYLRDKIEKAVEEQKRD